MPVSTGFAPVHERLHRAYNLVAGLLLLAAALPLLALLTVAVFLTQGWRVFYAGPRVGRDGRVYDILKFRTLDGDRARALTHDRVLQPGSGIETPLGAFLRDTRLDELPQLVNVVMGHMNICGPRPVRPEIAALHARRIANYADRFAVRPGLIGHTQAYMHHGTSKALRARYNRILCRAPVRYRGELGMIALVGACVLARTASKTWERAAEALLGHDAAHRERAAARALRATVVDDRGRRHRVERIGRDRMVLDAAAPIGATARGELVLTLPSGERRRARIALAARDDGAHAYEAATEYGHHVVSRYLWQAVVVPHRSHFWGAAAWRRARRLAAARPSRTGPRAGPAGRSVAVGAQRLP